MPPRDKAQEDGNDSDASDNPAESSTANWNEKETDHALKILEKDPTKYLSGNGFKGKASTEIAASLRAAFPTRPARKPEAVASRLRYIKGIFEQYEFVRGKSGVGWDDEAKKATAEPEYIQRFLEEHSRKKYERCFKKSCPYYSRLAKLFGGNKATGEHVLHLSKSKKRDTSSSTSIDSSSFTSPSKRKATRQPLETTDAANSTSGNTDPADPTNDTLSPESPKPYDDELLSPPPKRPRLSDAANNENETPSKDEKIESKKKVSARDRSASSGPSSGGRRGSRNMDSAREIANGLKAIGESMAAPIVTKADTSHVDAILEVLTADDTLLPHDPHGEYFALFVDALSVNEMRARVFVKTTDRVKRIAVLKRVLLESKLEVPEEWV